MKFLNIYEPGNPAVAVEKCPGIFCILPEVEIDDEIYADKINAKFGSKFDMPVVYYGQLKSVAYGRNAKNSALDEQIIKA